MVINQKVEYWKKRLLDMGKRNRLIHCALPKSGTHISRVSLLINAPASDALWSKLVDDAQELQFSVPVKSTEIDEVQSGLAERKAFRNGVQTNQPPEEAGKTLRSLMKKAKEFHEEKGLNALHLAFGFLNWRERGTDGQEMRSPLLLVPVALSQESLNAPISLSRTDGEISANSTLEQRLSNDFGVTLPAYSEDEDWQAYLAQVQKACAGLGWTVDCEAAQLSMFSFLKINMYRDLEQNADRIIRHPLVGVLNGKALSEKHAAPDIDGYQHDLTEPGEVFSVLDADSSQQDAVLLAKRGVSFVLQGPPGTGKSQTITNIIAELIADGKKVLFVSEKMAALEVVHKRLSQAGLGEFCLTLHSHNAKRREILDQMKVSLELSRQKAKLQKEAVDTLCQLQEARAELNAYVAELHREILPYGRSVFQVNGYLASRRAYKDIDYVQDNAESFTQAKLSQCVSALGELARIVSKSGYQEENPWKGCTLSGITNEFWQKFLAKSEEMIKSLDIGIAAYRQIADLSAARALPETLLGVEDVAKLLAVAQSSPGVPSQWVDIDIEQQMENIKNCADILADRKEVSILESCEKAWNEARAEALAAFDEGVLDMDAQPMLGRYRTSYRSGLVRFFGRQYRKDRRLLLGFCKTASQMPYEEALLALDRICKAKELRDAYEKQASVVSSIRARACSHKKSFASLSSELSAALSLEISEGTDFEQLKARLQWVAEWKMEMCEWSLGRAFVNSVCALDEKALRELRDAACGIADWRESFLPLFDGFCVLLGDGSKERFEGMELAALLNMVKTCGKEQELLENWVDYKNAEQTLATLGIVGYLEKAKQMGLGAQEIVPVFEKCFYRSWLDQAMPNLPAVSCFRRDRQMQRIEQFRTLDEAHLKVSQAALRSKLISSLPNFESFSGSGGEVALLLREMAKQRKLMPTRKLLASIPNLLSCVKPCMMMSPLSVSTYLASGKYLFDTVIFDEASQIRTEDAICSIFRAKQAIIAGDSKQLPPTDFFAASISDSDEFEEDEDAVADDTGAYESLLDEAALMPSQTLLWHYRSRHEHLIAFSNAKIYNGSLVTFPSSTEKADNMGVEYIHVPDGVYDRGKKTGNRREAERVAELVFEHFQKSPERSLGIIAFGVVQQTAIEDAILRRRRENPRYEAFFKEDVEEALFIKNLETVQGDERDTILFSIGYAPDENGKLAMNFGPLSRVGGERRLNVAVTRARYNLKLVGSILPTDIDVDRTSGQGPRLLRMYIDFAMHGAGAILGEAAASGDGRFDSPFEESVYQFLVANGFDVEARVGCFGYRIDMAVRHPKQDGRYAIGIECDGSPYRSARTARERERLRQSILEAMGWKICRVWSIDWVKDTQAAEERLLREVGDAIKGYGKKTQKQNRRKGAAAGNFLSVKKKSDAEILKERTDSVRSIYAGQNAKDIPIEDFEQTMLRVLAANFGLDKEGLFKETAVYGYQWSRRGGTIKSQFEEAYSRLLLRKEIWEEDGKIRVKKQEHNIKK